MLHAGLLQRLEHIGEVLEAGDVQRHRGLQARGRAEIARFFRSLVHQEALGNFEDFEAGRLRALAACPSLLAASGACPAAGSVARKLRR